jgi:tetratricopeptide (TPR) repeat protein
MAYLKASRLRQLKIKNLQLSVCKFLIFNQLHFLLSKNSFLGWCAFVVVGILPPLSILAQKTARDSAKAYLDNIYTRVDIYQLEGQHALDTVLMIDPTYATAWQQKAMPHLKNGDFPHWIELIDKAVALDANRYLGYRAFCKLVFMKDYEGALRDFNQAQLKAPNATMVEMDHSYDYWRSLCYLETNRLDSALYFMQKSVDEQQKARGWEWTHYGDMFYLGLMFYEKKDIEKALYYLDKSLTNSSQFPDALYYKSLILNQLGKQSEAVDCFNKLTNARAKGYRMNEDNEIYANYPRQIGIDEVAVLSKMLGGK